jgi:hypothetical protein
LAGARVESTVHSGKQQPNDARADAGALPDETLINDVVMPPVVVKQATAQLSWGLKGKK